MMSLDTVQFVIGQDGQPVAVQVDMELWRQIVAALENAEDVTLAREALAELNAAGGDPEKAGWVSLNRLRDAWLADDEL